MPQQHAKKDKAFLLCVVGIILASTLYGVTLLILGVAPEKAFLLNPTVMGGYALAFVLFCAYFAHRKSIINRIIR